MGARNTRAEGSSRSVLNSNITPQAEDQIRKEFDPRVSRVTRPTQIKPQKQQKPRYLEILNDNP